MGSFNLFPSQKPDKTRLESAWCKVAAAFAKTGTSMWTAINALDAQIQSSPPNMTYGK